MVSKTTVTISLTKKKKNHVYKKDRDGNPFTRSTRQIKAQKHMSQKNITIRTPLIY
jgi:hypothetical protein